MNFSPFSADDRNRVLRSPEAAAYLGVSESWLKKKRMVGAAPPAVRLSENRIGYRVRDLDAWLDKRAEAPAAA